MSTPTNPLTNTQTISRSGRVVLVGGGVRSGKSAFALERARSLGQRRAFIATAEAFDDEMRTRIARHIEERRDEFETFEAPRDLVSALDSARSADVVVIDCLTLWLSNLLLRGDGELQIAAQVETLMLSLQDYPPHVVIVTNEVGMGIVPESTLGRIFRDVTGRAHQRLAVVADEIYFAVLGTMLRLRPEPITTSLR
jgi:adenosylcobinamide kinase/adenosylcobinamide-phosphate guanylyltransferase